MNYNLRIGEDYLFKPDARDLAMEDVKVNLELNSSGSLKFIMPSIHPMYSKLEKLKTYIDLYDENKWIWRFRVLNIRDNFNKMREVECEGLLSVLVDSVMYPFEHQGTTIDLLRRILNSHNSQVESDKRLQLGVVTVNTASDYINRSSGELLTSLECINSRLISSQLGGYIRIRRDKDNFFLDYLQDYANTSNQVIRYGENLLGFDAFDNAANIGTRLIAYGSEMKDANGDVIEGINGVAKRVDLTSVNGGKDYVEDVEAQKNYGIVTKVMVWDDVTQPNNLLTKAKATLKEMVKPVQSIAVDAVDLSYIESGVDRIELGETITLQSIPHDLEVALIVSKMDLDLREPSNDTFTIGKSPENLQTIIANNGNRIDILIQEKSKQTIELIENQARLITGAKGGNFTILYNDDNKPYGWAIMDTDDIKTTQQGIMSTMGGIGFYKGGFGKNIETAWTLDGTFNANFINAGTLSGVRVEAQQGFIGNFEIKDGVLTYITNEYDREYVWSDLSVIKNMIMKSKNPTDYEMHIYDTNDDGSVTSADYVRIKNYLEGNREKPKHPMIKTQVLIGTNNGEITSKVLFNGKVGYQSNIYPDVANLHSLDVKGLSIDGRSIEPDSNGFLKIV